MNSTSRLLPALVTISVHFAIALPTLSYAQIAEQPVSEYGVRYGEADVVKYRVGVEVIAHRGACRFIKAMVAVPYGCDEQQVTLLEEDISSHVDEVTYRTLDGGGVRQMLVSIRRLPANAKARAIATFEVKTRPILPPEKTDNLRIPERVPSRLRRFTSGSPFIEVRHNRIRKTAREILADEDDGATDWQRVEAIYDYVLQNAQYIEGDDKSALETLREESADCHGRSALFVALCRAGKIPARLVWVDGHCYPEFYLEHADGEGSWYPCESAGTRAFGEMPLARTILQKGDDFRVPERPEERLRYASDFLIGVPAPGSGKPQVRYHRHQVIE